MYPRALLSALPLILTSCASRGFGEAQLPLADPGQDVARVILIGDTGALPVEGDPHKMTPAQRAQLRESLRGEEATIILDLGDLFYNKAPECKRGDDPERAGELLDANLYDHVGGLGPAVFLVLGNHDVGPYGEYLKRRFFGRRAGKRSASRERCYSLYAEQHEEMIFPDTSYGVDIGPARVAVLHTSAPHRQWPGDPVKEFLEEDNGDWAIVAGHHVYKTACDKVGDDFVGGRLAEQEITPDLYVNGHAHLLQMGVFDGVPAATSGSGSKLREFPGCEPTATEGVLWGESSFGYAVLDITPQTLRVAFKDIAGQELYCWQRGRDNPQGESCK